MAKERIERHHGFPKHSAKRQDLPPPRKKIPLTLPWHALVHGKRYDNHGEEVDKWAEKAIMKRMTCEELDTYLKLMREA